MAVKEAVLSQLEIEFTTYFSAQNSIVEAYKETHNDDILIMSRHILTEEGIQDFTDADIKSLHPTINIGSLVSSSDWAEQFYTTYEQQIENELEAKELNTENKVSSYGTLDIMEQEVLNFIMNNEMFLSIKIEFEPADIQALRQTNLSADFICDAMHRHYDENDFIEYIEQNQIDDIINEVNGAIERGERVLITTLTKRMSEDLSRHLKEIGYKVTYMHSDVDTLERMKIIRDLRLGKVDVLVGINLLREGLDLPEVSRVCILDADKEGFLRSVTSLIQTAGRAARNADGKVIMYADTITPSMRVTIDETSRRRKIQEEYNEEHGITPKTIVKSIREVINTAIAAEESVDFKDIKDEENEFTKDEINEMIDALKPEMYRAAEELDFEKAAEIRDKIKDLREKKKSALL